MLKSLIFALALVATVSCYDSPYRSSPYAGPYGAPSYETYNAPAYVPLPTCPVGWFQSGASCFMLIKNNAYGEYNVPSAAALNTWANAKKDCEYRGATLIAPITQSVFDALKTSPFTDKFWVGVHSTDTAGVFHYNDEFGTVSFDPTWWSSAAESSKAGCVQMDSTTDKLSVVSCDTTSAWYCQKPMASSDYSSAPYKTYESKYPATYETKYPSYESKYPSKYPSYESKYPTYESKYPSYESKYPSYESKYPSYESKYPASYESKTYESKYPSNYESKQYESKYPANYESKQYESKYERAEYESKPRYESNYKPTYSSARYQD